MSRAFETSPNLKGPLLLNNSSGISGQVLTSQGMFGPPYWATPAGAGQSGWTAIIKTSDQTVTNSTVLVNDTDLRFAMQPGDIHVIRLQLFFDTTAAADFKWRHTGPASPQMVRLRRSQIIPGATAYSSIAVDTAYRTADITATGNGTTGGCVEMAGLVFNGLNGGYFQISWAQNSADVGQTIVRAGSLLEYNSYTPGAGL